MVIQLIQQITSDPLQTQTVALPDGSQFSFTLYFVPMQYGWFFTTFNYGDFTINGLRITNSLNLLNSFRNQLPFGIACISASDREPSQQADFGSAASNLYVLSSAEVNQIAEFYRNG